MRLFRLALVVLPLTLSGCGVPDLVAYGIKSVENSDTPPAQSAVVQPAAVPAASHPQPPPPAAVPAQLRPATVTVEPLK